MDDTINTNNEQATLEEQQELSELLQIRRDKLQSLRDAGNDPFEQTKFDFTHFSADIIADEAQLTGQVVRVAGRMMSRRIMGKASFAHIADSRGSIQLYVKRDDVGEEAYAAFKSFDIGDILGAEGTVFQTRTGEVSVHVTAIVLLAKSLLPLPEKFHGLKDTDLRYRQRYVDLIMNPETKQVFVTRSKAISAIREYLDGLGYIEVETPILQTLAGGATARPFVTHHNTLDMDLYLRIALELHLKRLIVGGLDRVYEIGRAFRNEGMSVRHNPEFTMVELYQAYTDYEGMMEVTEALIKHVVARVLGTDTLTFDGNTIDMASPFARVSMVQLANERCGVDFETLNDEESVAAATAAGVQDLAKGTTRGKAVFEVFDQLIEHTLIQPTFVIYHPVDVSPLAKRLKGSDWLTERFELFVGGRELANAFSELNDPVDQYERFAQQVKNRQAGDDEAHVMDDDFITALEYGMPPTGGMGMGIDRLVMLLTDSYSIRDVLLFPTMKPKND